MSRTATEARHGKAEGLDTLTPAEILVLLASGQQAAAKAVDHAVPAITKAADLMAAALKSGGRVVYAGAGSAGLVAMADAMELPGTYGIPPERIAILFAGGVPTIADLPGGPEDDASLGKRDADIVDAADCVICVSASGSTPYTVAVAETAKSRGAKLVAMANNAGAKLFEGADAAILLETPPEVVSGSTRMGAGTAQKIAFNMFSTMVGIHLGHVLDGHMVNLRADNIKLRGRAIRIVSDIAGIGAADADRLLGLAGGSVKLAILLASGARDITHAEDALERADQNLRRAIAIVGT
jgi:N-acetylmuramic acid 6-phosphate etherase